MNESIVPPARGTQGHEKTSAANLTWINFTSEKSKNFEVLICFLRGTQLTQTKKVKQRL